MCVSVCVCMCMNVCMPAFERHCDEYGLVAHRLIFNVILIKLSVFNSERNFEPLSIQDQ